MLHRACLSVVATVASFVTLSGVARAAVVGSYTGVQEVSVSAIDPERNHVICSLHTPLPGSWNVFGTVVTPTPVVCRAARVNGVLGPIQCRSIDPNTYADNGFFYATATAATVQACVNPPDCTQMSLINTVTSASGSLHSQLLAGVPPGGNVLYTTDGMEENRQLHFNDGYTLQVPPSLCQPAANPPFAVFSSEIQFALNVFADQPTDVGTDVVVSTDTAFYNPITRQPVPITVDVTFSEVTQAGQTMIFVQSNDDDALSGFALGDNGFQSSVLQITTTAQYSGTIDVCTFYPDVDNDGLVDGSSVSETELKFLHGENGVFIDRTSSRDVGANVVCGTVEHFSPFVATVPRPCAPSPRTACSGVFGLDLKISRKPTDPAKSKLGLRIGLPSLTPLAELNLGSPLSTTAYELCIYDESGLVFEAVVPGAAALPLEEPWKGNNGIDFKFKDKTASLDGITSIIIDTDLWSQDPTRVSGGGIKLKGKGVNLPVPALPLAAASPSPVTVQFMSLDPLGMCLSASTGKIWDNTETKFKGSW